MPEREKYLPGIVRRGPGEINQQYKYSLLTEYGACGMKRTPLRLVLLSWQQSGCTRHPSFPAH